MRRELPAGWLHNLKIGLMSNIAPGCTPGICDLYSVVLSVRGLRRDTTAINSPTQLLNYMSRYSQLRLVVVVALKVNLKTLS